MEAHLYLEARVGMIGSATDFTYKWCINMGMTPYAASGMALAVDELLTDIILFAYPDKDGYVELWYQYSLSEVEIIIQENGEPFDPRKYQYSHSKAIEDGDFKGAGLELVRNMTNRFLFLNRGKEGKEFRLIKDLSRLHISDYPDKYNTELEDGEQAESSYLITPVTSEDAEDIAKLIYKSYDYTYSKDDLYFPKRVEMAVQHGYKFGVIVRTSHGGPAGYFAVIRMTDSLVGEVGEAVVSPAHRKKGLMKKMLNELIQMSRQRGLLGLYGFALTIHLVSQKVNEKYGFKSTALLLASSKGARYKGFVDDYPQPVSFLSDFLLLDKSWDGTVYLPENYSALLRNIYEQFDNYPEFKALPDQITKNEQKTDLNLNINYRANTAVIIVREYGNTFEVSCKRMLMSLEPLKLNAIYIDLPMNDPWIEYAVNWLRDKGFIFAGLMPFFHKEHDFLRMQKVFVELDFNLIEVFSDLSHQIKNLIKKEYHAVQENQNES